MASLHGILVALITPFTEDKTKIDEARLESHINHLIAAGTHGLVPGGSTGEFTTLCVKFAAGRVPVVAGTGSTSTAEAVELAVHAAQTGAAVVVVIPPFYDPVNLEQLTELFSEIHGASKLPIITGASGYLGGDILHALRGAHPEHALGVLVRDEAKAGTIATAYPEKSVEAIARGLSCRDRASPGFRDERAFDLRYSRGQICDLDGADVVRDIIHANASKRVVANFILNLTGPRTALVFSPIIYGRGRGAVKQRSVQIPELARVAIETGKTVQVGKGESTWSNVHITDVSDIFVKLVEKGVQSETGSLWNKDGLYFAGNTRLSFGQISQQVAKAAQSLGLVESDSVKQVDPEVANKLTSHRAVLWETNAQQNSQRARELLGWQLRGKVLEEEIPATVRDEAGRLGK
ncbi:hypothetical protein BDW59DRAFT_163110 [Aspergillus cavernicola]|uniref:Dihydrodipicolinate synthetase family protein n=1 Tax=Aspergillus cavernicola TaxID=176166 RepID=A0ABR4I713_9EURO